MAKETEELIQILKKLEDNWDNRYMLFSQSGFTVLVAIETKEVLATFPEILSDGGDPGIMEIGGKEYLMLDDYTPH